MSMRKKAVQIRQQHCKKIYTLWSLDFSTVQHQHLYLDLGLENSIQKDKV